MQVTVRITSLSIWWIAVVSPVTQLFNQLTIVCASLMIEGPALRARNGSLLLSLWIGWAQIWEGHIGGLIFEAFRLIWSIFGVYICVEN